MMLTDKDFIIKGSKAYVSFVRSYDEHKVSSIFKTMDLDFEEIAKSFFLFRVPFIKELKGKNQSTVIGTEEEIKQLEAIEFTNKNQAQMIAKKIEADKEKSKKVFFCLIFRGVTIEEKRDSEKEGRARARQEEGQISSREKES